MKKTIKVKVGNRVFEGVVPLEYEETASSKVKGLAIEPLTKKASQN